MLLYKISQRGCLCVKIKQRLTSQTSYTDIIAFDAFKDEITGFTLAWLCGRMEKMEVKSAVFAIKAKEGRPPELKTVSINTSSPKPLITRWRNNNIKTIIIDAEFNKVPVSIQLQFDTRLCSIEYAKNKLNISIEFAKEMDEKSLQYLKVIFEQTQKEIGSCIYRRYQCKYLKGQKETVYITDVFLSFPESITKWYTFQFSGEDNAPEKYLFTKSEKQHASQLFQILPEKEIQKIKIYMLWQGKGITVVIHPLKQVIDIYADKWIGAAYEQFVYQLNSDLYAYFHTV